MRCTVIRCIAGVVVCSMALAVPAGAAAAPAPGLPSLPVPVPAPGTGTLQHNPAGGVLQGTPAAGILEQKPTAATTAAIFDGFHSVLAFGEGEGTSDQDLALFEANGTVPAADLSQDQMYEGLEQAWPASAQPTSTPTTRTRTSRLSPRRPSLSTSRAMEPPAP